MKKYTEKDLVSFGSYLLSKEREKTIVHKEMINQVGHQDIENWKHLIQNIKNQ